MLIVGITASGRIFTLSLGRGGLTARDNYIDSLALQRTFEWLFEGGDPSYLDGASQDPDFDNVTLQLLFNGADASTTIEDESPLNSNISAINGAQLDTAQFKFGVSSLLLDGTNDQCFQADNTRYELGSGEWTIEMHVRFNGDPGTATMPLISKYAAGQKSYEISLINNELVGTFTTDGSSDTNMFTQTWNPAGDTWYHLAFCRENSATDRVRVFVDGTQLGSDDTAVNGNTFFNGTSTFRIGTDGASSSFYNGWMDEYRITVGTAKYTANFTAPTESMGRGARTLVDTGGAILPAFSQSQLSFASVDSIKFERGVDEGIKVDTSEPDMKSNNYAFELWYQQEDFTPTGRTQFTAGTALIQMAGTSNNSTRFLGTINSAIANGQEQQFWPAAGRNGSDGWESFVDTYGDNLPHQLMEIREASTRANYIVVLDGIPIADGSNADGVIPNWDGTAGFELNGRADLADIYRPGTQFGSLTFYDNGEEFTLQKVRELFEVSALNGHDMLTVPKWVELDAENVTVEGFVLEQVTMGDVDGATGIRSGAIPRTGKIYFEQEIISQGDSTSACRVGIRRMITIADVGATTDASEDGDGHHIYVNGDDLFSDDGTDLAIDISTTSTGMATGTTAMFAIDWNTGKLWMGRDGVWGDNGGDPENGTNEIFTIDTDTNWAAHVWNSGTDGNGVIRLKCKLGAMKYTPPVGFDAWANNFVAEAGVNGTNNRLLYLDSMGHQKDAEYLFEGSDTTAYRFDSNEINTKYPLTEGAGMGQRALAGTQLSYASVDSVNWGRSSNDPHASNSADISAGDNAHTWELWYRLPDASQSLACLIGGTLNSNIVIGKPTGAVNCPACRNNFNADLRWESEVETYGDNKMHQLMEVHDGAYDTDYFVTLDGMPIADGTNSGWFFTNTGGNKFNGDVTTSATGASGADFGSYHQYRGGVPPTLYEVRRLYEISALDGNDMLSFPQWCTLTGVNITTIGGTGNKDLTLGDVTGNTGIISYAIPRNGKVYFELEVLAQGDTTTAIRTGIRKITIDDGGDSSASNGTGQHLTVDANDTYWTGGGSLAQGDFTAVTGVTNHPTAAITGQTFRVAIDWDTGEWWIGDDTNWAGVGGTGDPGAGTNSLDANAPIDTDYNWAVWAGNNGAAGNGQLRLVTASGDMSHTIPTGFSAWEDAD